MTLSSLNLRLLSFLSLLAAQGAIADTITENGLTYELDDAHTTAKLINVDSTKTSVNIPQYLELSSYYLVNEITEDAFANCNELTELTLSFVDPDWTTITIPQKTFANCPLEKVMLGRTLDLSKYESPFYSKESIKEIEIGWANTDVTWRLFGNCKSVETIIIQNGVESIESSAFMGFTSLISLSLPSSLLRIESSAFENCTSLNTLTIPKDIVSIGQKAFYDCNSLKNIYYLSDELVNIEKNTFSDEVYSSAKLHVTGDLFGKISYPWDNFSNIKYEDGGSVITYNNLTYILDSTNNTATLIGADTEITSVVIPANITGSNGETQYSVNTVSGNPFMNCKNLSAITIEDSKAELCFDNSDFRNCTLNTIYVGRDITYIKGSYWTPFFLQKNIRQLTLGEEMTAITDNLFRACDGFESVVIPSLVTYIGEYAFGGCSTLKNIKLPEGLIEIKDRAFNTCNSLETIDLPKSLQFIGRSVFWNCTSLTNIEIPQSVTMISSGMFENCTSLTSVKMPGVKTIGARAFIECTSLTEPNLPEGLSSIQESAFSGCSNLKSITFPNQLDSIGEHAFIGCKSLTSINIPASVKTIGYAVFGGTSINTLTIEDSENPLELMYRPWGGSQFSLEGLFDSCPLKKVYIGRNLKYTDTTGTDINNQDCISPFFYNREIEEVTFGNNVTIIPDKLFWASESLKTVMISTSVRYLGNQAFDNCISLENIVIPNSVISLGVSVFSLCTALKELKIPESVTSMGKAAFAGCKNLSSITFVKKSANSSAKFAPVLKSDLEDPTVLTTFNDSIFMDCQNLRYVEIPSTIVSIRDKAFMGCSNLDSIVIPESVTEIGTEAFQGCTSLKKIDFPDSIEAIGERCFYGCSDLLSVKLPENMSYVGEGAFQECTSLKKIELPDSIETIGERCFYGCSDLLSVKLPAKISYVGEEAFGLCTNISQIVYPAKELLSASDNTFTQSTYSHSNLYIPASLISSAYEISPWKNFENIKSILTDSIAIGNISSTLRRGETMQLSVEVFPEDSTKSVIWASSDTSVATVNESGLVTAIAPGTTVISATAADDSGVSDQFELIVEKPIRGDANDNGVVTITDAVLTSNYIIGKPAINFCFEAADINGDGRISISDVTGIIQIILTQSVEND